MTQGPATAAASQVRSSCQQNALDSRSPCSSFRFTRGKLLPSQQSRSTGTMNGKIESCSNNQDEQDVNQYPKDGAVGVAAAGRTGGEADLIGKQDKNKWDDNHIIESPAEAAFLGITSKRRPLPGRAGLHARWRRAMLTLLWLRQKLPEETIRG